MSAESPGPAKAPVVAAIGEVAGAGVQAGGGDGHLLVPRHAEPVEGIAAQPGAEHQFDRQHQHQQHAEIDGDNSGNAAHGHSLGRVTPCCPWYLPARSR